LSAKGYDLQIEFSMWLAILIKSLKKGSAKLEIRMLLPVGFQSVEKLESRL
jgi:hypothetical protein